MCMCVIVDSCYYFWQFVVFFWLWRCCIKEVDGKTWRKELGACGGSKNAFPGVRNRFQRLNGTWFGSNGVDVCIHLYVLPFHECLFVQPIPDVNIVSDIAIFVLKRDVKLQLTNQLLMLITLLMRRCCCKSVCTQLLQFLGMSSCLIIVAVFENVGYWHWQKNHSSTSELYIGLELEERLTELLSYVVLCSYTFSWTV